LIISVFTHVSTNRWIPVKSVMREWNQHTDFWSYSDELNGKMVFGNHNYIIDYPECDDISWNSFNRSTIMNPQQREWNVSPMMYPLNLQCLYVMLIIYILTMRYIKYFHDFIFISYHFNIPEMTLYKIMADWMLKFWLFFEYFVVSMFKGYC